MKYAHIATAAVLTACAAFAGSADFVGRWALNLPGGGAGWLNVEDKDGKLQSQLLWGGGSVLPTFETKMDGDTLIVQRNDPSPAIGKKPEKSESLRVTKNGADALSLVQHSLVLATASEQKSAVFPGKRCPAIPAKPDLSKVKFGRPIELIGKDMDDTWEAMNKTAFNGWSVKEGVLSNRVMKPDGKAHHGTNIKTKQNDFFDFNLRTEVRVPPKGNSGIYLRGNYEIQIAETHGKNVDSHNMGALYSRITPLVAAEKPANEWQTLAITLCDAHVTVVLNGKVIIDNEPVLGCTGGAMSSDDTIAGPIYLQGDHTDVDYRNMVLTPVIK